MANPNLGNRVTKLTERIKDLPTLPIVANNIIQIVQNPRSSALEVGKAISQDQALASKVLRTANSAFYGFPGKITTITHAIVILGFGNVRNIVLTASIFDMFSPKGNGDFDREGFWEHSLACGVASKLIAKRLGIKNLEEVFIFGLLHDLGKLVLDRYFNEDFTRVVALVREKGILIKDAERTLLGIDHAAVGGMVAEKWGLPPVLVKAIRFHHNPSLAMESMRMIAIVHLGDIVCRAIGIGNGGDSKIPSVDTRSWEVLGINKQILKRLFLETEKEMEKAKDVISLVK
jgi:putative nucleotidyltransferase with HDIG domain